MTACGLSLPDLAAAYANGAMRPNDVVDLIYERIGNDPHHAWIHVRSRADARRACDELERRRARGEAMPLYGVPFGVKDNIDVAGMPTTAACPEFAYSPDRSARCVELLLDAGALCIGKTNLDQFATGLSGARSPYGVCTSAKNQTYISGGSSSGSAVAVSAGHVSFALGTDTGGSGRIPAGFNDVVGVKPTIGRVSTRGLVPNCPTIDCVSILALTVADGMALLNTLDGFDPDDPFARPARKRNGANSPSGPFRFGCLTTADQEFFGCQEGPARYQDACTRLAEIGGIATEIDFEPFRQAGKLLFDGPWIAERTAVLAHFIDNRPDALLDTTRTVLTTGQRVTGKETFSALHRQARLKREAERLMADLDCVVLPTAPRPFTVREMLEDPITLNNRLGYYSYGVNLLDLCALAVPNGSLSNGMPTGVTLIGRPWTEHTLARVAQAL